MFLNDIRKLHCNVPTATLTALLKKNQNILSQICLLTSCPGAPGYMSECDIMDSQEIFRDPGKSYGHSSVNVTRLSIFA